MLQLSRTLVLCVAACGSSSSPRAPGPPVAPSAVRVNQTPSDTGMQYRIASTLVALESPEVRQALGLPASGRATVAADVRVTGTDLRTAEGSISLGCPAGCVIGDDKTNLAIHGQSARVTELVGSAGIAFGHLTVDHFATQIAVGHGRADIKTFEWTSPDVELSVSGGVTLGATLQASHIDVCVRFKPTAALSARDPRTAALLDITGAPMDSAGRFDIRIVGPLSEPQRLGQACGGATVPPLPPNTAPDAPSLATPSEPPEAPYEVSAQVAARLDAGIHAIDATTYDVDHSLIDLAGTDAWLRGARMVPTTRDGKPEGVKIYAIHPGSFYERLGLKNGDTILAVDGRPIGTLDQAHAAVTALSAGATIVVTGTRRGQLLTLTYHVR